ncbi:serine protease [Edwardsiella piscicida]|uniref:trypsin-like serine peptidase n=1 Tax=Edwardsiella piscicida TaxID=1263550 RepID=UPI00290EEC6F|nr:serine protease [Edwardsiella piscicida]ELM3721989.1 serine protease [Edwardsiella piscicida]ELM3727872.1 serine protease [Edwardsiella piscicida]ELV7534756.1 serine protease [Edwardsiella piscicida]
MRFPALLSITLLLTPWLPHAALADDGLTPAQQRQLFFGHDDRDRVSEVADGPWNAIGQVETASGNLCTATLIAPRWALTAGHCLLAPPGKTDRAVALRFISQDGKWRYQSRHLQTRVNPQLYKKLKADGDGWIVPPAAAPQDYGLVEITAGPLPDLRPLPVWQGTPKELSAALKAQHRQVTQAGYPQDHLDVLYRHRDCLITGWAQSGVLSHRCDTLPGDSGSPLLMRQATGWTLVAIQSSAPAAENRALADNRAVAVTAINAGLQRLMR